MKELVIKDFCYISDGNYSSKYPRSDEFKESGIPFIRANNLVNGTVVSDDMYFISPEKHSELRKGHLRTDDVLITTRGNIGQTAVVPAEFHDANINAQIVLLRVDKEKILPKYLEYALHTDTVVQQIESSITGTALKQLPVGRLEKIKVKIHPKNEQEHIVSVLQKIDALTSAQKEQLETIETIVKSRFIELFGDINANNKNWNIEPLGNLCDISRGGSPRPIEQFLGGTIPWIKIGDATDGDNIYLNFTKEHILESGVKKSRLVKSGSLIFANCGVSLGFARIITFDGCIHDGWLAFENIDSRLNKIFLLQSLNQMTEHFRAIAPAGTQPNLNTAIMKAYMQIIPPIELQNDFIAFVEQTDKLKLEVKKSLEKLQTLKKSLMQQYFG